MVRTKANNAAVRKAVAAKAPRKQVGGSRVPSVSSPSSGRVRKPKASTCGNPVKSWPTPTWQKGIDNFLSPSKDESSSSSSAHCESSSNGCSSSAVTEEHKKIEEHDVTSDGEEIEEETDESAREEEEDLITESEEEESEIDEEDTAVGKVAMLSKDLATCGSDTDDD